VSRLARYPSKSSWADGLFPALTLSAQVLSVFQMDREASRAAETSSDAAKITPSLSAKTALMLWLSKARPPSSPFRLQVEVFVAIGL